MGIGKQAKVLTLAQEKKALQCIQTHRNPKRDRVMFLLSVKAGLRAIEISRVEWSMVTNSSGEVGDTLLLENRATKGGHGGREIILNPDLQGALLMLHQSCPEGLRSSKMPVIRSERGGAMTRHAVVQWFKRLYADIGATSCSSHSGRRTFITRAARNVSAAGGSLRDVQELAGHSSLSLTQRYIEGSTDAKRKLIEMA